MFNYITLKYTFAGFFGYQPLDMRIEMMECTPMIKSLFFIYHNSYNLQVYFTFSGLFLDLELLLERKRYNTHIL